MRARFSANPLVVTALLGALVACSNTRSPTASTTVIPTVLASVCSDCLASGESNQAIQIAKKAGVESGRFPPSLLDSKAPLGYVWSSRRTSQASIYLVALRTPKGNGWTWRVDIVKKIAILKSQL